MELATAEVVKTTSITVIKERYGYCPKEVKEKGRKKGYKGRDVMIKLCALSSTTLH